MDSDAAKAAQQKLQSQFGAEKTQLEKQAKDLQSKGEAFRLRSLKCPPRNVKTSRWNSSACAAPLKKVPQLRPQGGKHRNQIRQSMAQQIYDAATTIAKQQKLDLILDAAAGA